MNMTDTQEKTPNKRKSLAAANGASAKKAKSTPQKQNGTPKAQNKKTPEKSPAKETTPAKQSKSPSGSTKDANGTEQLALNKIRQSLNGENREEAIKLLKSKIQELESKSTNSINQEKLANLKDLLAEAGETIDKPTGKANKKAKSAPKGKGKKKIVEEVEDDEDENDVAEEESESENEDEEEQESDDDAEDEEESEQADEEDSEGNDGEEKPKKKDAEKPVEKKPIYEVSVAGLPSSATEESIREHFSEVGEIVSINILKEVGKAFLKLPDKPTFVKCFNLHHSDFEGKTLKVWPALEEKKFDPENTVIVHNLPLSVTEDAIREHFSEVGEIVEIQLLKHKDTGEFKRIASIKLANKQSFINCFNLHHTDFDGQTIIVYPAVRRELTTIMRETRLSNSGGRGRGSFHRGNSRGNSFRGSFSRGGRGGGPMRGRGQFNPRNNPY